MEEWKEYKYSDLCLIIGGGTPKTSVTEYWNGNIPWLSVKDFNGDKKYVYETEKTITENGLNNSSTKLLQKDDIIISARGTVGEIAMIPFPMAFNQSCFGIRANSWVNNHFLYYITKTKIEELKKSSHGSVFDTITRDTFEKLLCSIPSFEKQKRIADILSSLDDKIELNRRINENLEKQAQALFKSWFVDFEPFKDGKFVDSELGMIPEELTISHIGDIPHIIESGRRPKGGAVLKGVPSIGAENIKGLGYYDYSKTKYIPEDFALTTNRGKINGYELLIYKDGGKPGYFIPNYTIFGEGFPFDEMFINEHVFRLDLMSKKYNVFAYFYMQTPYIMNQLNSIGGKAAIPGINTKDVESLPIFNGDNKKIQEFGNLVLPMITTILRNCRENARLAQLRDTLLPRLMSGELKISDIDNKNLQE